MCSCGGEWGWEGGDEVDNQSCVVFPLLEGPAAVMPVLLKKLVGRKGINLWVGVLESKKQSKSDQSTLVCLCFREVPLCNLRPSMSYSESRVGAVVRALAFHQCVQCSGENARLPPMCPMQW